ncbi:uncharacterized protein LOC106050172 isoform X2 [Biomphalaria glabrata]|uniref:Uncharacterized protein LOC106050172 isoform X2 n=1 Tax=Biomphalaria glabrata TaxID=6526 RepID=A0A9W2Z5I1_BIOGL|nr:uncharacterized protein LOC106050172 isoform X2 [Biomphalaria glabrata]
MEIKTLKDFASIVQSLKSKKKTTLDIFYNVENCSDLLGKDHYQMYTPTYAIKTEPVTSCRGFIKKDGPNRLIVGLAYSSSSQNSIAKCSTSVFNKDTEKFVDLSKSEINLSSTKSFEFPVKLSELHRHIYKNNLLFKWNIEVLPSLISHAKVKSPNTVSEDSDQKDNIATALDGLFETLSRDKQSEREEQKTLLSMVQNMTECKNQQTKLEDKLQSIEQKVFDINSRLSDICTTMTFTQKRFVEDTGLLTQSLTNPVNTEENKMKSEKKTTLDEDLCTISSPLLHEKAKYHETKERHDRVSTVKRPIPTFINPTVKERDALKHLESIYEEERTFYGKKKTGGVFGTVTNRALLPWINTKHSRLKVRHILLIGSDIHLIRSILLHEYNILPPWSISETHKLVLMECEDKGVYFYIGLVPEFSQRKHILSLMISAQNDGNDSFDGCILVINSPSDTNLLHVFDTRFLQKFCFLLVSKKFNYLSLIYDVKGIVRIDWLHPSLEGKFKLLEDVKFVFDEYILSTSWQEKNELQENVRSFMSFLTTIQSTSEVEERMESLTDQMMPLLKQCHTLLEVEHTEEQKNFFYHTHYTHF